ncbi:hypothetical protein GCK72_001549 [Caenorhabditis remanei]|uniref:Uncharacterized protein n=1 Tax=Caenorhabditis remanei TaxID=31234 RepID=A0A6A5HVF3_CAERE|nr:hypothetical protein GCK72_001549 [Caenorhabditis remanei]KAF1769732.1 hypothetical protein GCK72_001549 [Caenorhabditis remanei]
MTSSRFSPDDPEDVDDDDDGVVWPGYSQSFDLRNPRSPFVISHNVVRWSINGDGFDVLTLASSDPPEFPEFPPEDEEDDAGGGGGVVTESDDEIIGAVVGW